MNSIQPFSLGDESHRIAKELFTIGVQAAVKSKILELKQLQAILADLQLSECIGTLIQDNTRLLLEVKQSIEQTAPKMEDIKGAVQAAITDTVKPVVLKKQRKDAEDERK